MAVPGSIVLHSLLSGFSVYLCIRAVREILNPPAVTHWVTAGKLRVLPFVQEPGWPRCRQTRQLITVFGAAQQSFDFFSQDLQTDRLAQIFRCTSFEATFPVARHGQGGQSNDRGGCEAGIGS